MSCFALPRTHKVHCIQCSNSKEFCEDSGEFVGKSKTSAWINGAFCTFQDLENTASSDAGVRERIASLPPEVSEVSLLANLADRTAADQLSAAVNEAATLLADYNGRLQAEMEDRRRLLTMLRDYTLAQRQLLQQAQSTLEVQLLFFLAI